MSTKKKPFIGHFGHPCKIVFEKSFETWVLKQSQSQQISIILMFAVLGFGSLGILLFQSQKINGGIWGILVIGVMTIFGIWFFVRFLSRFISGRRVEIDLKQQRVRFIPSRNKVETVIEFRHVRRFSITEVGLSLDDSKYKNFVCSLEDDKGQVWDICVSSDLANAQAVENLCRQAIRMEI